MQLHPQLQATKHVADFVWDNDGPRGLLIVYYAGHGWAEDNSVGRISLAGRFPEGANEKDMSIEWTEVEHTLGKTMSDVLVIFDCCHAGLLCRPAFRGRRRSFYYVAACKDDQKTRSSGKSSFTSAFDWALKELAHSPGFTVTRLVKKLMEHEPFPRDQQEAVVYPSRFGPGAHEIWISPLPHKRTARKTSLGQGRLAGEDLPTANILDLRLHFSNHAPPEHIEETAIVLKDLLETKSSLHFHRITFIDHTSLVEWSAKHWLKKIRRRSLAKDSTAPAKQPSTLIISEAAATRLDRRLSQLHELQTSSSTHGPTALTTAITSSASSVRPWVKDTADLKPSLSYGQILIHFNIALGLLVGFAAIVGVSGACLLGLSTPVEN